MLRSYNARFLQLLGFCGLFTINGGAGGCSPAPDEEPPADGEVRPQDEQRDKKPSPEPAANNPPNEETPPPRSGSSTTPPRTPVQHARGEVFWQAFNTGRYDDIPLVQDALEKAIDDEPSVGYLKRLLGVSYFWKAAEISRDVNSTGATRFLRQSAAAFAGAGHLEDAKAQAPDDPWLPCFLGLLEYSIGEGTHNAARREKGIAELNRGIALYPELNTYCRAQARSGAPRDSQDFAAAIEDYWTIIKMCSPEVTPDRPNTTTPSNSAQCTQRPRVPHGYNGFWLTAGDVFTKAGKVDIARAFYENAKLLHFDDWPYANVLNERLASVSQNASLFADAVKDNDPPLSLGSAYTCVLCHSRQR